MRYLNYSTIVHMEEHFNDIQVNIDYDYNCCIIPLSSYTNNTKILIAKQ